MTPGCHHTPSVQADSVSLGEAEVAEDEVVPPAPAGFYR
jgi:hypothetical protein